jgi:hypothetical protein
MNLKIYRKLFLLIVLSVGLFFTASSKQASAEVPDCCDICYNQYTYCVTVICGVTGDRDCVERECLPEYQSCTAACYPLICD